MAKEIMVRIEDGRGTLVRVRSGSVWITQEGDTRDRFVPAGGRFLIDSDGVTLVSALSRSTISLVPACRPSLVERLGRAWESWFVPGARPTTAAL
jgi:hypothetical protein